MIAGIDLGTQGIKVLLLDGRFRARGKSFEPYPTRYPRPGWVEQDPRAWEQAMGTAMREALLQAGAAPEEVQGLGITGQLDGCIAVDENGLPIAPCLIWMDRHASLRLSPAMRRRVRSVGGVNPDPGHMAAKIRWLMENVPDVSRAACEKSYRSYRRLFDSLRPMFDQEEDS